MCMTTLNPVGVQRSQHYSRPEYNRRSGLRGINYRVLMEEQGVGNKKGLDCIDVPDKVLEGGVDPGEDQTKAMKNMGKYQVQECVEVGKFYEVLESRNEVGGDMDNFQEKVLQDGLEMGKQDSVLNCGMEGNEFQDMVLEFGAEVDKVSDGGLDMDKVKLKVLDCGMSVERFQDKLLKCSMGLNTAEDKFLKGDVDMDEIHGKVLEGIVYVEEVLDDVLEDGIDMNEVQNKMKDSIDVDKTLGEVLKGNFNVNENSVESKKVHDTILEDSVDVEVLNTEDRMDTMRCQVKITTRHNLHLLMANHTTRDVHVRLLRHGERITGRGLLALKDSVHLSPLKPSMMPEDPELEEMECHVQETEQEESSISGNELEEENSKQEFDEDDEDGSHAISDTAYSPCSSVMPTPVQETQGGVDYLFQNPGRLLKELHNDPEMQAELWAERQQELTRETAYQSLCSSSHGTPQIHAFLHSAARLIAVASILLLFLLVLLLVLLESDLDVSFLQDIRETPEFEQFHYEYYCPLRRWICYKLELLTERLWGD